MKKTDFAVKKFRMLLFSATMSIAIEYIVLLSDNIIVGNLLGEKAIAGININVPFLSLCAFVSILMSTGSAILATRSMGEFDKKAANQYFSLGLIGAGLCGIVLLILMLLAGQRYIQSLHLSAEIHQYAVDYFRGLVWLGFFQPLYSTLYELVYTDGDDMICNAASVIQVVSNIGLSVLLCFRIGIIGVSLATIISILLSTAVVCLHFGRAGNSLRFCWYFNLKKLLEICKLSIPDASLYFCFAFFSMILNRFLVMRFSESALPVFTVAFNLVEAAIIFDGIGEAIKPLVSVYYGEKNTKGIQCTMRAALRTAVTEGLLVLVFFLAAAPLLPRLFGLTDAAIAAQATAAVRIVAFLFPCYSLIFLFSSYYLYTDHVNLAVLISLLTNMLLNTSCAVVFGLLFGLTGVWVGIAVSTPLSVCICCQIIRKKYGKDAFPMLLDSNWDAQLYRFSLNATQDEVMTLLPQVRQLMQQRGTPPKITYATALMIEELGMLIAENNKKKPAAMECTLDFNGRGKLILRDDGIPLDLTNEDIGVASLRHYVTACIMQHHKAHRYLMTTGYNRYEFDFQEIRPENL